MVALCKQTPLTFGGLILMVFLRSALAWRRQPAPSGQQLVGPSTRMCARGHNQFSGPGWRDCGRLSSRLTVAPIGRRRGANDVCRDSRRVFKLGGHRRTMRRRPRKRCRSGRASALTSGPMTQATRPAHETPVCDSPSRRWRRCCCCCQTPRLVSARAEARRLFTLPLVIIIVCVPAAGCVLLARVGTDLVAVLFGAHSPDNSPKAGRQSQRHERALARRTRCVLIRIRSCKSHGESQTAMAMWGDDDEDERADNSGSGDNNNDDDGNNNNGDKRRLETARPASSRRAPCLLWAARAAAVEWQLYLCVRRKSKQRPRSARWVSWRPPQPGGRRRR
jgi:hypothetical protein